jgi:transposase
MVEHSLVPLAAVIGLDWSDRHHDIALQVTGTSAVEQRRVPHDPAALTAWLAELEQRFAGQLVGIAIETSRGPVVSALLEVPFVVLYPVNPRSLRRFREAFSPNGAKDDGPDACLLLELLAKHRAQLQPWVPDDLTTRTLRRVVEHRRTAIALRTQLTLQLQAVLKEYFPQALRWAGTDLATPIACHFLQRWPSLAHLQRARPATIRQFYRTHHCRSTTRIEMHLEEIRTATALTTDPALCEGSRHFMQLLTAQLLTLGPSIAQLDAEIAHHFAAHPDAAIFQSFPGAGAALAPRLLVAFGTDRARWPAATDMQKRAGIAPITVRSGRQSQVHWRWATSTFLRQTFHEFAHHSILHTPWAKTFYHQQRAHGKKHHAAVRALAFKWIRILWRCWSDRTPYDSARYERALHLRHSPLSILLPPKADTAA